MISKYLPYPEVVDLLVYPLLVIILVAYNLYARRKQHALKLPTGLFICYFTTMALVKIISQFELPAVLNILELLSTIFLTLAIIRFITFILIDYLMRYKKVVPIPVISRDIGLVFVYIVAVLVVLRYQAGVNPTSLITTSAVLTAVIGFALQDTLGNLIAGIVLQMEKPYNIGDWVCFDNYTGRVVGMSWKSTRIVTREKEMVSIPNNLVTKGHILNYSQPDPNHIATFTIGTSYNDPPNSVREAILTTLAENSAVNRIPAPEVRVVKYNDFSIDYRVRFYLSDFESEEKTKSQILNQLWYRFRRHGITIPFPIRTIQQIKHDPEKEAATKDRAIHRAIANLRRVDIFSPLSEEDLDSVARRVRFDSFSSGEVIIRESDSGKSMYVIVSGEAVVVLTQGRSTENIVATLKAGDFFGEMSLLTGEPRTATVKAKSDVVCMKIEKEDLEEIMSAHSEVAAAMSEILVVRKEGLTELKDSIKKAEQGANKKLAGQFLAKIKSFFNIS